MFGVVPTPAHSALAPQVSSPSISIGVLPGKPVGSEHDVAVRTPHARNEAAARGYQVRFIFARSLPGAEPLPGFEKPAIRLNESLKVAITLPLPASWSRGRP